MKYHIPNLMWDRRELEFRELERQKEMQRLERERLQHHQQQMQSHHHSHLHQTLSTVAMASHERECERERRDKEQYSNAEQAVSKHFEESLRRAKKQMRSAWTLNALPPQHPNLQHLPAHLSVSSHVAQSQIPSHASATIHNTALAGGVLSKSVTSVSQSLNSPIAGQHQRVQQQQSMQTLPSSISSSSSHINMAEEQRLRIAECERLVVQREREREQDLQRERDKDREMNRIRHKQDLHHYTVTTAVQQRGCNQTKLVEKTPPPLQLNLEPCNFSVYNYTSLALAYQSDVKTKSDPSLPVPPPLMSDAKPSPGSVIVKHEAHKQTLPTAHISKSSASSSHQSHFKSVACGTVSPHIMYEYHTSPLNTQNDRYNMNAPSNHQQTIQYIAQTAAQAQTSHQQHKSAHFNTLTIPPQTKPKVSSPAPAHIYGQPCGTGITCGIAVNRVQQEPLVHNIDTKSGSPSPFLSHVYVPPVTVSPTIPPPAHTSRSIFESRIFSGQVVKPTLPISIHGPSPPTATATQSPISRSPGVMMNMVPLLQNTSLSIRAESQAYQTQPLDLGLPDRSRDDTLSPKQKGSTPLQITTGNSMLIGIKKPKTLSLSTQCSSLTLNYPTSSPPPTVDVSAVLSNNTTAPIVDVSTLRNAKVELNNITTVSPTNICISPTLDIAEISTSNTLSTTNLSVQINSDRTNTDDGDIQSSSTNSSVNLALSPGASLQNQPGKAGKLLESKKLTSPAFKSNYEIGGSGAVPPRHLKKAWLQRHTGEDFKDTTGVVGSGSCVKLPLTLSPSSGSVSTSTELLPQGMLLNQSQSQQKQNLPSVYNLDSHIMHTNLKSTNFRSQDITHKSESDEKDESSSSDQQHEQKSLLKRKSTKLKRRKGGRIRKPIDERKKKNVLSESDKESDSDKDSISDSDSNASTTSASKRITINGSMNLSISPKSKDLKEPRKRGRRPKTARDEPLKKKSKEENEKVRDPFHKPPITQLKKTGQSFLQDGPCFEVAPKLSKCRECRWTPNQRSKNTPNIFCRFYAFRRLRYTKNGQLAIAGFSDPHKDPTTDDIKLWMPDPDNPPLNLDLQMSRFLLSQVADQFCDLLQQEKEAMGEHMSEDKIIAWKRVVQGVREMCDVCETTLFNYHWACGKCGFVVCIDCYKDRKQKSAKIWGEVGKDRDDYSWLLCTNRAGHEQNRLMLTQIIAGDSLQILGRRIHEARALWQIPQLCGCSLSRENAPKATNGICKDFIRNMIKGDCDGIKSENKEDQDSTQALNGSTGDNKEDKSALSWLADVALQNANTKNGNKNNGKINKGEKDGNDIFDSSSDSSEDGQHSTLRELLIRSSNNGNKSISPVPIVRRLKLAKKSKLEALDVVLKSVQKKENEDSEEDDIAKSMQLKYYIGNDKKKRKYLPIRIMTLTESKILYPDIPHSWLCDGKLLRLLDASHVGNFKIFQEQWKRGQPVLVSDVSKYLDMNLWLPESFARDFGEEKNDLVNCMNGNLVPNQPMKKFWDGFEYVNRRLKDEKGYPMLLKLKDWPPGEDFAEILPSRFNDLMKALPLGDYTQRSGRLNLASRLPDGFVRPDLGPKMYNAYGSALHPTKGTTNLHLDISDAVNVMVYVGIPKDGQDEEHIKEAFRAIDEAGCDILTRRRVREKSELPGALWHIYSARDADKIRDLLNKVAIERGARLEPNHDPIHDQSWYLDSTLRERLYKEYGVEGYPIAQCLGDAVFIPAGAPHQVRNLHNCIKVAEDFVSPENVSHCFHLTQEFRELSETHSNHEDKLQIKNIIYHAVKDALACLSHLLGQKIVETQCMDEVISNKVYVINAISCKNITIEGNTFSESTSNASSDCMSTACAVITDKKDINNP